jgi:orotate phosphoribosyltransferase/AMMECR1 domain-containing protein
VCRGSGEVTGLVGPADFEEEALRDALATILSSMPEQFRLEREELLDILIRDGILYRTPAQPVLSRDGTSARWMLNSLAVTLTPRGAELAGRCILELLSHFDGTQIATYGLTAVPIVQSCIMQSSRRYRGLLVRQNRKQHGSLKLIEGQIDLNDPVILIDDSISSGMSMQEGCKILEEAGLRVEGGVALVRFGWYGGYAAMQERGYHMEAVYDIWDDFMGRMEDEEIPLPNPSKWFPDFTWSPRRAPEGLHPARLARTVLTHYLESGELLRPPQRLDAGYDGAGGAWVSIRSRENIYVRHARDGFWHFPGEQAWPPAESVVRACLRTADDLPRGDRGCKLVEDSSLAVTFFSQLQECTVGELDNDRYGIVVCSQERSSRMGGALPRMPGIADEWQQFEHARKNNAKLVSFEPYRIYRHEVNKAVEPDAAWQPTGVPLDSAIPWHKNPDICARVAGRALDLLEAHLFSGREKTAPLSDEWLPRELDSIYVTVYVRGHLRGCKGSVIRSLDCDLHSLVVAAASDERFSAPGVPEVSRAGGGLAVTVSLLFDPLDLGEYSPEDVLLPVRHGQQALMVYQGQRAGLLLPFVASMYNLDPAEFVAEVIDKAGITRPPYRWKRFECSTWLADSNGVAIAEGGFPFVPESGSLETVLPKLAELQVSYLVRQQDKNGSLYLRYEPFQDRLYQGRCAPRLAHGAWTLVRAYNAYPGSELKAASDKTLDYILSAVRVAEPDEAVANEGIWLEFEGEPPSVSEKAFLLLALCELPSDDHRREVATAIASSLWSGISAQGRITTHRDPDDGLDAYQDYFPGQVLLALARACKTGLSGIDAEKLNAAFKYYRHRFRYRRSFGHVSWMMQAFTAWWRATPRREFAGFVFEIGDWILQYQQEKTGAFVNSHQQDTPGYTSALYLEGIAAAIHLADDLGDGDRHRRYAQSLRRGFCFLDRLVIQPRDASVLPNPEVAIGGLRQSLYRSEIRVDFVQHCLAAILEIASPQDSLACYHR